MEPNACFSTPCQQGRSFQPGREEDAEKINGGDEDDMGQDEEELGEHQKTGR